MDIHQILIQIGYSELRDFGKDWRTRPIYRNSGNQTSLSINKTTGEWYDFSSRMGGGLAQLVQKTLQLPDFHAAEEYLDGKIDLVISKKNNYELRTVKKFDKELLFKLVKDHSYWINRKISPSTIELFEGGTTNNGRMKNRYVFPIFDSQDDLVGFSGRILTDNPNAPKWKHLGSKTNWCYPLKLNADIIIDDKEVVLVESIGDMLALWDNGIRNTIVTFGIDISPKIIEFLLRIDVQKIFIGFNNDEENEFVGNEAAIDGKVRLSNFFDENQVCIAVPDEKDFGEMNPAQIQIWKQKYQLKN